ncbi:MAG: hypothetical protein ABW004_03650, partial [Aeromicrobium sp.]
MRTSLLTRSAIAVATFGIASAALVATPATAAVPSGITRQIVLTAAANVRAQGDMVDEPTQALLQQMAEATCGVAEGETLMFASGDATAPAGDDADGLLVTAIIFGTSTIRACQFGAVATTNAAFTLTGTATLTATVMGGDPVVRTGALSGNVAVTAPISDDSFFPSTTTFTAAGNAARTTYVAGTKTVKDKKSKAEKKAAKKKYQKRLAAAKKKYVKALDKAGNSTSKKAAAKKSYSAAKKSAKAKYKKAISGRKQVKVKIAKTEKRPFS